MSDDRQARLARALAKTLADETTPLIRNAWYVAARSADVSADKPFGRKILGERVVMFRGGDGKPVAMKDRCAHRSFPLSESRIENGEIVCGYHGFRYDHRGRCTGVPSQATPPQGIAVPTFKVVEQEPLIWIWMGDPVLADEAKLPAQPWMLASHGWAGALGYLSVESNYVHLHENLLDLTHLTFVHAKTFGTPDYASAPFETEIDGPTIRLHRTVQPTRLPPVYARPLKMEGVDAARIVTSTFVSPAMSISAVVLRNLELPESERVDHHIRTAQLLTPADQDSLHYHFLIARDFAVEDAETTAFIHKQIVAAFHEDVEALRLIDTVRREDRGREFLEHSVGSDRAGVAMRQLLRRLADQENAPAPAQAAG